MNEIEKMYENCGIYPDCRARECGLDYCANSSACGYAVYPEFTAEKQIELIKWLTQKKRREITISFEFLGNDFYFGLDILACSFEKTFEEALARLVNNLLQDLTEEERKQLREILK